jgi:hypothetical protein
MIFLYICLIHLRSVLYAGNRFHSLAASTISVTVFFKVFKSAPMVPALGKRVPGKGILYGPWDDFLIQWSPAIRGSGPLIPVASHSFRHLLNLFLCSSFPLRPYLSRPVWQGWQPMSAVPLLVLSFSSCLIHHCLVLWASQCNFVWSTIVSSVHVRNHPDRWRPLCLKLSCII